MYAVRFALIGAFLSAQLRAGVLLNSTLSAVSMELDLKEEDGSIRREVTALWQINSLLDIFPVKGAVALALTFRGSERIVATDDAEFLALLLLRFPRPVALALSLYLGIFSHMDMPLLPGISFNLSELSAYDCRRLLRFDHQGLQNLFSHLRLPAVIVIPHYRDRISGLEALILLLRRLVYPRRLYGLTREFNRHESALSRIIAYMQHRILLVVKDRIFMSTSISERALSRYCASFWRRGVPEAIRVWSVIDVKKVGICRPSSHQRAQYSGHVKSDCFKFQTLQTPDGMCYTVRLLNC
jgi:hypothetical protein